MTLHSILFEKSLFTYDCVFQDNKYRLLEDHKKWPIGFQEWLLCPQKHHDLNRHLSHIHFSKFENFKQFNLTQNTINIQNYELSFINMSNH
jgi:hypothetical protein